MTILIRIRIIGVWVDDNNSIMIIIILRVIGFAEQLRGCGGGDLCECSHTLLQQIKMLDFLLVSCGIKQVVNLTSAMILQIWIVWRTNIITIY